MNNTFYVYTHLGLGDQIICNGIINNICKKMYDKNIILFAKPRFAKSVKFMFKHISNLTIEEKDDHDVQIFLNSISWEDKIKIGHNFLSDYIAQGLNFDEAFYKQVGLKFSRRWDDFKVVRDIVEEEKFFSRFNLKKDGYIFLHEDKKRGLKIKEKCIVNKKLPIFTIDESHTDNIFDYLTLIDNAKEIHCIDSCFKLLIDSLFSNRENLFYHLHLENNIVKDYTFSQSRINWNII